jgi:hypothetical protein
MSIKRPEWFVVSRAVYRHGNSTVSVDSILLSAKTDGELATAGEQIKQIAETPWYLAQQHREPSPKAVVFQILTHRASLRCSF